MSVAIIDYGSGNLRSAAKAMERAAREAGYAGPVVVTADPEVVRRAERVVLPGVGAFADCRRGLLAVAGMEEALREAVLARRRPFLGICVGMQLMATAGFEHGETAGLGWVPGRVIALAPDAADAGPAGTGYRIPHMG
jgi:glutamine amidotransferase